MPPRQPLPRLPFLGLIATGLVLGFGWAGPAQAQTASGPTAASAPASPEAAEIQRLLKDGQHAQALKLIDESLSRNPKDPQMRFRRGVALSMLDRKSEALAVFQKLVDDHPDMPAPYNNMAVILGAQGDYEKARQALDKAIRTNPAYATAYQNLGDVYAQLASQAYAKALQLDKADTSVQPKLALLRELTTAPNAAPTVAAPSRPAAKPPTAVAAPARATVSASAPAAVAPTATVAASSPAVATVAAKPASAPAAAAVAASKASAAPSTATAAAAKPVPATAANANAEVEAAVRAWAAAWAKRDMAGYYAAYTPDFTGQSGSRKTWEQERRDRIATRKQIKVEVSDLVISVSGDQATAKFRQSYSSDALSTSGRKTLRMVRGANGRWMIKQETVGG
jgi:Flp pilus assembly protein TadD/ketosteroid isomerase-like protein